MCDLEEPTRKSDVYPLSHHQENLQLRGQHSVLPEATGFLEAPVPMSEWHSQRPHEGTPQHKAPESPTHIGAPITASVLETQFPREDESPRVHVCSSGTKPGKQHEPASLGGMEIPSVLPLVGCLVPRPGRSRASWWQPSGEEPGQKHCAILVERLLLHELSMGLGTVMSKGPGP